MTTIQKYYQIIDYGRPIWSRISAMSRAREQLHDTSFLSAQVSCLIGEKGVGKTVLACQKALRWAGNDTSKIFYVSLDDTLFADDTMYDIALLAQDHGVQVVIFDEVHRYPAWKEDLKKISDRLSIRCIISGSSILSFKDLGGLARRMVKYELKGMSFREYLNIAHGLKIGGMALSNLLSISVDQISLLRTNIENLTNQSLALLFEEYLRRGYYAYAVQRIQDADFHAMLRQATEDTIAYEIVLAQTHSRPDMARKLQAIFKAISQNVPYTVDYEALKTYAHISDTRTLKHYLACLEDAGMIRTLARQSLKALRKPEKIYLGNSCLYHAYADLKPNTGSIREVFFLTSLALAGQEVLVHERSADFAVDGYTFEVGGARKGKNQILGENKAFVARESWEPSSDPAIKPLWLFGMLARADHQDSPE